MITKRKLLRIFDSQQAIARVLGISGQSVNKWKLDRPIPALRELQLQTMFPERFGPPHAVEAKGFTTHYTPPSGKPEERA